ncbi:DUF421 domain-containing protein [Paenibacillus beijingensis]|uniref:DUF421 domain-containing protein n=1 Tax=Paenibacillus beijingensis TaxID=1126833 RepID=UPI0009E33069|nr:DUF421 domain-containing protein [Paenibacillus beijingensis]
MEYGMILTKLAIAIIGLWSMMKMLGKKEISQLTAFDFVSSLMLSELVGNTIYDKEASLSKLVFAMIVWTLLSLGLEKLIGALPWLSRKATGSPDLLIQNGVIDYKAMKRNNLDFNQLGMLLRENNVFSVSEVAYAVFETNGSISVLLKSLSDSPSRGDLNLPEQDVQFPFTIIENGWVDKRALRQAGKEMSWLMDTLHRSGIQKPEQVLYAEWTEGKGLYFQLKPVHPKRDTSGLSKCEHPSGRETGSASFIFRKRKRK